MNALKSVVILLTIFANAAYAAGGPIKGTYSCKGTSTKKISIGAIGAGSQSANVKGKMTAKPGKITITIKTPGWTNTMIGWIDTDADYNSIVLSRDNVKYKQAGSECQIIGMSQYGWAFKNTTGRRVSIDINQEYYCGTYSSYETTDSYDLTCTR